jgi:hypothetical protein
MTEKIIQKIIPIILCASLIMTMAACTDSSQNASIPTLLKQVTVETVIFTASPTVTPSPTLTATIGPTSTITPTPDPAKAIIPGYSETITETIGGVPVTVILVTDQSIIGNQFVPIDKIFINPAFGLNANSENANQAVARLVAEGLYLAWQNNGTSEQVAKRNQISFSGFTTRWAECLAGTRPWEDLEIRVYADDRAIIGYDPQYLMIRPGPIKIIFFDSRNLEQWQSKKWKAHWYPYNRLNLQTNYFENNLEIWIGYPFVFGEEGTRTGSMITPWLLTAIYRLSWSSRNQGEFIFDNSIRYKAECWLSGYPNCAWEGNQAIKDLGGGHYKTILAIDPSDDPWNGK